MPRLHLFKANLTSLLYSNLLPGRYVDINQLGLCEILMLLKELTIIVNNFNEASTKKALINITFIKNGYKLNES